MASDRMEMEATRRAIPTPIELYLYPSTILLMCVLNFYLFKGIHKGFMKYVCGRGVPSINLQREGSGD
eukprot:NODE_22205_length_718_cov_2.429780.p5 GENE.NODE_22205_length_718_cov_2.429780~~NODE_22205_length_718_cov_2.429780.p5  ORF type:complete len:68 (-),score=11.06 NODE_22205_length_718_cov_2.429780:261-464(-)